MKTGTHRNISCFLFLELHHVPSPCLSESSLLNSSVGQFAAFRILQKMSARNITSGKVKFKNLAGC